ncbi:MAG: SDR family NAD(P)-dependent oxidoreductase [Holophagales bacterium]|nr:SDR family NAD(P)-dependent oxidoreductase [Holophagales bacterium]MXX62010.1 SDR family NAD(P)-dependent oxidoreductase [Holophagales bacterium]MYA08567.1 SDR family NAD(P)-dependent oxidoreductase [Holophagales bacterium]MYC09078.1 SDR family NAD(P)-dependent oxidoreductase [Holophagales bacterium]MYD22866.1 SDR family NAD(P)-dependent oxidoreductase [Holophagales bacterium]
MTQGFTDRDVPDQSGRTFLVTGANTGIGFETARVLARQGARVLLGCRSEERAAGAIARINAESPEADLEFLQLDQADLASVRAAAERAAAEPRLDVLVNNAGIMGVPRTLTVDGFEAQFGVNHLGTFALTGRLLPKLEETEGSRVVITASVAHRGARIHWADIDGAKFYSRQTRYQQSKLANLMYMHELDRRFKARGSRTIAVACHPGLAQTDIGRRFPLIQMAAPLVRTFFNTQATGAWPTLLAATGSGVEGGDYYGPSRFGELSGPVAKAWSNPASRDPELGRRLWELSVEMTGVDPGI